MNNKTIKLIRKSIIKDDKVKDNKRNLLYKRIKAVWLNTPHYKRNDIRKYCNKVINGNDSWTNFDYSLYTSLQFKEI